SFMYYLIEVLLLSKTFASCRHFDVPIVPVEIDAEQGLHGRRATSYSMATSVEIKNVPSIHVAACALYIEHAKT
ncbi:MAG: hypothetical protein ABJ059_16635, partial [Hyphomicrobiales bacterium]